MEEEKKDEKNAEGEEKTEIAKEKIVAEEKAEEKINKTKALKLWFKNKPEEEKKKEPVLENIKKDNKKIVDKKPRDWGKLKWALTYSSVAVILVASIVANAYLYYKYKEIQKITQEESAKYVSWQNAGNEKIDDLTKQIEKISSLVQASQNASSSQTAAETTPPEKADLAPGNCRHDRHGQIPGSGRTERKHYAGEKRRSAGTWIRGWP